MKSNLTIDQQAYLHHRIFLVEIVDARLRRNSINRVSLCVDLMIGDLTLTDSIELGGPGNSPPPEEGLRRLDMLCLAAGSECFRDVKELIGKQVIAIPDRRSDKIIAYLPSTDRLQVALS